MENQSDVFDVSFDGIRVICSSHIFINDLENKLINWYNLKIEELPRALKLMGLEKGTYDISREVVNNSEIRLKMTMSEKEYTIEIPRGDMANPYPSWILSDGKFQKHFNFFWVFNLEEICTLDTEKSDINDDTFALIKVSKLSLNDKFLQYEPQSINQRFFRDDLIYAIRYGLKDFYRPIYDPSIDEYGNIVFVAGKMPAVGHSYNWWEKAAKEYMPKRGSRLGTKNEYIAFLGVLIKKLIASGWSTEEAWKAVCDDSKMLGHYSDSEDSKHKLEETGSREVCGFFDLANTRKLFAWDDEEKEFTVTAGKYFFRGCERPLANLYVCTDRNCVLRDVGWFVLSK